jgi:hypothetical protein
MASCASSLGLLRRFVLSYRHYDLSALSRAVASFDLSSRLIVEGQTRVAWSGVILWDRSNRTRDMCIVRRNVRSWKTIPSNWWLENI